MRMGTTTGRMSQTNPDLQAIPGRPDLVKTRWVEPERSVVLKAREGYANYFCNYEFNGQVPKEKEKND